MAEQNTRTTHELYVGDNPPTTQQILRLAAQVRISARATNSARVIKTQPGVHFSVQEMYYSNEVAEMVFDDYPAQIRRLMAIRIGRRTLNSLPTNEWSMKFFDTTWYERPGGEWNGVRTRYRFEWAKDTVTLAERQTFFVPSPPETDMYDELGRLSIGDDAASMLHAEMEMSQITADDFTLLASDIANYYRQSEALQHKK